MKHEEHIRTEMKEQVCCASRKADRQVKLCDSFVDQYRKFAKEFNDLSQNLFNGELLHRISKEFFETCSQSHDCLARIPFSVGAKFPHCSKSEALNEDLQIVSNSEHSADQSKERVSECAKVLADLYRRACQGYYLYITFKMSRQNRDSDRWRAVEFGRYAIRYDPTNFEACYWYMIALGWQLDVTRSPRERTLVARTFYKTTLYCIQLNPSDPLAYHLLGRYYYNVAGLSWLEKTVAEKLLGASMDGTYQDAEREFRRAHQLKDDWLPGGLWMARVLLAQKRPIEELKTWIDSSLSMECVEPSSEIELRELLELKSKLKLY